jgi:hypothetical protein
MSNDPPLPAALLQYLPDSELEVVSWSGGTDELVLRVTKDIGMEVGLLRFGEVSHVNLIPRMTVEGIDCGGLELLPPDYLETYRGNDVELSAGERVFLFRESWGAVYFVVATSVGYEIQAADSVSSDR